MGVDDEGKPIASVFGRDVTEAHEKANTKAQLEVANAANAAKTAFLFNMPHDIRTPMNAIIGFHDLLEKHQEEPEKRADYLRKIEDASSVLLSIINNGIDILIIMIPINRNDNTFFLILFSYLFFHFILRNYSVP